MFSNNRIQNHKNNQWDEEEEYYAAYEEERWPKGIRRSKANVNLNEKLE